MTHPIYFILDDFGKFGRVFVERAPAEMDLAATMKDIADRQFNQPIQVIEVNLANGTSRDVTTQVLVS